MRKVLLDTNLLIAVFDKNSTTDTQKRQDAEKILESLLEDENSILIITPLIRYEVLRGISIQDQTLFNEVKQSLDGLTELDITRDISELAADLFRFDRANTNSQPKNIEKRKFDVFHLASAKCHDLELASQDSDIQKLETLYQQYQASKIAKV